MEKEAERVAEAGGERKRKKTLGRQKIEIKRIACPEARHVCFSKRRNGLYKKATELCVLTGAHLAIIVFSPADKPYSYGHPSVNAVLDRYLDPASYVPPPAGEATRPEVPLEYENECERLGEAIKAEGSRRLELDAAARAAGVWTDDDVRRAGMPDLAALLAALERVQAEAAEREGEILAEKSMMQQWASTGAASDAFQFQYPGAGTFTADGVADRSSHQEVMDMQMMLMGGNVGHAAHAPLPFAPMMLPPDLPPQPPFNYGYDHNHIAGYAGYGFNLGHGSGHGAAYESEGCYETTTTTCNFFG
ncbi:hypothetical protein BAE44_0008184 [Dichanthelium oligosanthes]|uniref:MADS-box domain-containing protein n=1 Tax=Dichanthelium oligosanthes TaxID=888268 RepID=A0A1E5W085_9POAL|nr:hypothetical protein BAE44_0008184 [Dichanthelium oligosanthes]